MLPYFQLGQGYINFNHGSYGCTPREVTLAQQQYMSQMEAYPDLFFRVDYRTILINVRQRLAKYVGTDTNDLVLVENASGGVNTVLKALKLNGAKILISNIEYGMTVNTLKYLANVEDLTVVVANVSFPVNSSAEILSAVEKAINENPNINLAVFSHISSIPSLILPIKEITDLCKKANIPVLVDGAHAIGQIPLNIPSIGADYYVANGHKWLFSPKGSAILWVSKDKQKNIVPLVISSSGNISFVGEFEYTGTRDYTAFLSMGAALDFRIKWGDLEIMEYNHQLAVWAGNYLSKLWNTRMLVNDNSMVGSMVNVVLPTQNDQKAQMLTQLLFDKYNMYLVAVKTQGIWYARISAQIFLEQSDFVDLGKNVLTLIK